MNAPVKFGKKAGMGQGILRTEDKNFITGKGMYSDDVNVEGELHAFVLRSPYAHAKFKIENIEDAKKAEGVKLILTADDLKEYNPIQCLTPQKQIDGSDHPLKEVPLLADGIVKCVGEGVAFIVAQTYEQAREASEMIEVDYDMLEAIVDTEKCLEKSAPLVHEDMGTNLAFETEQGNAEETQKVFKNAKKIVEMKLLNNRLVANYIEPRACLAEWSDEENRFTLITPSQGVFSTRRVIAHCMNIDIEKLRVKTYDVGGGFGTKMFVYREYPLCLIAAEKTKMPVRWLSDRNEHFMADAHGRDNIVTMKMAVDEKGKFLALDIDLIAAMGAYLHMFGPFIPHLGRTIATGIYDIPACRFHIRGVYTHTTPTDAYRGAGRPEAIYALERLVDRCAIELNMKPDEIRRVNALQPNQMPYKTIFGGNYDTGEFMKHMDACMKEAKWDSFKTRNEKAKENGKIRGIGMATFIEACAFPGSEPAKVELQKDGTVTLYIGTQSNGQGHKTAYAQFIAEELDMDIEQIEVRQGDTDELPDGGGTGGSRSIPLGAASVKRGSVELAEKMKEIAADKLEADVGDMELEYGTIKVTGTDKAITFAEIAKGQNEEIIGMGEFVQEFATYPNGTHICEIEVEPQTGISEIVNYTIVDDYGVTVNPLLLAGQIHGGVAQAIGQCLMERTHYDEDGQLVTASFMDYQMPRAADIPNFNFQTRNVPSTTNELGVKGAGEAGTIGGCPAVMNALVNALHTEYGIKHIDMPALPLAVWETIQKAK